MTHLDDLIMQLKTRRFYGDEFRAHVDATIKELIETVMPPVGSGIPSRGQAMILSWLEKCKSKGYVVEEIRMGDADDDPIVNDSGHYKYPVDPYRTPHFKASVHMPDGTIEQWGRKRLRETGGMIGKSLPWDTRYGADLHYNASTGRIVTVEGPRFRRDEYENWARHY
jgi:hypothetical protein